MTKSTVSAKGRVISDNTNASPASPYKSTDPEGDWQRFQDILHQIVAESRNGGDKLPVSADTMRELNKLNANVSIDVVTPIGQKTVKKSTKCEAFPKSPLRYPGGKSRAVPQITNEYIPKGLETLCSPFVGGGSIELALASRGTKVYAYDAFAPLVDFWRTLIENAPLLAEKVRRYENMTPTMFYNLQKTFSTLDDRMEIAAVFFVLNRSSFSGTTLSGGMSPGHPRFTASAIERLEKFTINNFSVGLSDFKESIPKHANDFLYCDPPYLIDQKLYGKKGDQHSGFDHEALRDLLVSRDRWVLSYNDCEAIRKMYDGHKIVKPIWTYGMGNSKESSELLILSKGYEGNQSAT